MERLSVESIAKTIYFHAYAPKDLYRYRCWCGVQVKDYDAFSQHQAEEVAAVIRGEKPTPSRL